jgi:hemolysin III
MDRIPYFHAAWHLFVLAGSVAHYIAILFYVVPQA